MAEADPHTLDQMQNHFADLYGPRNNIYLSGRVARIDFFNIAVGDLHDAMRAGDIPNKTMGVLLARMPSRIFCMAHGMNNVSVASAMAEKFPLEGCAYCHQNPCQCEEKRSNPKLHGVTNPEQLSWRLRDWQNHLVGLYGEKNRQRGADNTMVRLFKEVAELMSFEHSLPQNTSNQKEIER